MKNTIKILSALVLLSVGIPAFASERPIELSLFHPIQLHNETTDIRGVRLNLFYAVNHDVTGVDLGLLGLGQAGGNQAGISWNLIGSVVKGDMVGWQSGLYTHTYGSFSGLKGGLINRQTGELLGVQLGFINIGHTSITGVQFGFFNKASSMNGLQLGLVNMADNLDGLQIGLANFNFSGDPLYFFPFVNFSF